MKKIPVWIDCDTGIDDSLALLVANRMEALEIVGISTVSGNVHLSKTTPNTIKICDLMGADYPVYPGADKPVLRPYQDAGEFHGADGLGGAELPEPSREAEKLPMWDALYEAAKKYEGELCLVTVGPMTNFAIALSKYPQLVKLLKLHAFMGGATKGGNCSPCAEFNIYADPEAAQIVCRSGIKMVMCPLDVTHQAILTEEFLDELASHGTPVTRFVRSSSERGLRRNVAAGLGGIAQHDVCPVLYLAHPEIFEGEEAGVYVETQGELTLGKTVTDLYSDKQFDRHNALILLKLDHPAFTRIVGEALLSY